MRTPEDINRSESKKFTATSTEQCLEQLEQAQYELLHAREASDRALKAKANFLSNMSHELRTPLNAVIGMSEVLWETNLSAEQRELLSVLMNGGRSLLSTINDVLELSQIESGQLKLEETAFSLMTPIQNVVDRLMPIAESKGLIIEIDPHIPRESVLGDPEKLEQILGNLIGNAVKFTEKGLIKIHARRNGGSAANEIIFSVTDTGIGIACDKLNDLFKRFSQVDMSLTKTYGGTGLGLAIAKQLVSLMGGSIWVKSEKGKGSTFHFSARLAVANDANSAIARNHSAQRAQSGANVSAKNVDLEGLRILVVEDSRDNAFLISTYLKNIHCHLDFAENGQVAIEKFEANEYDLILMDIQMPEMDGYSATRWIRVLEKRRSRRVPIIALTAFTFADEVQKSFDAGCDAHLSKPIDKRSLLNAIARQIEPEQEMHAR